MWTENAATDCNGYYVEGDGDRGHAHYIVHIYIQCNVHASDRGRALPYLDNLTILSEIFMPPKNLSARGGCHEADNRVRNKLRPPSKTVKINNTHS